jgi:hypothetical protein
MNERERLDHGIPDLDKKCQVTDALFVQDQRAVNQEILRRCVNAMQKAFGKRNQKSTTVWVMVHRDSGSEAGHVLAFRQKAEAAVVGVLPFIQSSKCSVDVFSADMALSKATRLFSLKVVITRGSRRVRGIVSKHLELVKQKKAWARYPIPPRLVKKAQQGPA